jgi:hypothetical protein
VPGDRDAEGDGADDRGPQGRIVGGDGLGDLRLVTVRSDSGHVGRLGIGQHRPQDGQRRDRLVRQPVGERGEDLLGRLFCRCADLRDRSGVDHAAEQLLFGPEVVHDKSGVHFRRGSYRPDGSPLVPGGAEKPGGGVEDARFGAAALLGARTGPGSGHSFILRMLTGWPISFYSRSMNAR